MFSPNPAFLLVQKLKSATRALHQESRLKQKKELFNLPQVLINAELYGLVLAPSLEKGYHQIWKANLQPLGPMFQHLLISCRQCSSIYQYLGVNLQPQNDQSWPQVFLALTPSQSGLRSLQEMLHFDLKTSYLVVGCKFMLFIRSNQFFLGGAGVDCAMKGVVFPFIPQYHGKFNISVLNNYSILKMEYYRFF